LINLRKPELSIIEEEEGKAGQQFVDDAERGGVVEAGPLLTNKEVNSCSSDILKSGRSERRVKESLN